MPPSLSFPPTELNIKETGKTYKVLCLIRKKWLVLTPEEWVRQHVIGYLIKKLGISSGRIAVEKSFLYNQRKKRWDIVTFDVFGEPELLIECKGFEVALTQDALQQISSYQQVIKAKKLVLTNGIQCFVFDFQSWRQGIESIEVHAPQA
jgi:hypothetical protein